MGTNPFEDLMAMGHRVLDSLQVIHDKLNEVRPEWEPLKVARATRGKGTKTLIAAAETGLVRSKRIRTRGKHDQWLLNVADLDRHFPVQKK